MDIHDLKAHLAHLEDRVGTYEEQAAQLLKLVETLSQTCEDLRSERDGWHKAAVNYQHLFRQSLGLHVDTYGSGGDEHE
jgi:uncharacterized coiled-coil DUF342 family protein